MALAKCPECAREVPSGTTHCPWDGAAILSISQSPVIVRPSLTEEAVPWDEGTLKRDPEAAAKADTGKLSAALTPGTRLGDYEVRELLGEGGMGEVYGAEQPMIGKKVAIKVLKAEIASEPENVQRMLSEARSVNAIRHRSIVDIFNFGTLPDGRPYLVMEYLDGTPLDVLIRKRGSLTPQEVTEFLEEICSALSAAHARGIIHRDLKPGNVFLVSDGTAKGRYVKLLDFGLAKGEASSTGTKQTLAGTVVGTPDYIAPEQARGLTITPRTDLYSLGIMAFEMLVGVLPFVEETVLELMIAHIMTPAPRVSSRVGGIPFALDDLIFALMAKDPGNRPQSAELVRLELARIRKELRESATTITEPTRPRPPTEKELPPVSGNAAVAPPPRAGVSTQPRSAPPAPAPQRSNSASDATMRFDPIADSAPSGGPNRAMLAGLLAIGLIAFATGAWVLLKRAPVTAVVEIPFIVPPPEPPLLPPDPPQPQPAIAEDVPPRPPVGPKKTAVSVATAAVPTREQLRADLKKAVERARDNKSPLVDTFAKKYANEIETANTPDERKGLGAQIKEFERKFAPAN